jgi:hypothetical protein
VALCGTPDTGGHLSSAQFVSLAPAFRSKPTALKAVRSQQISLTSSVARALQRATSALVRTQPRPNGRGFPGWLKNAVGGANPQKPARQGGVPLRNVETRDVHTRADAWPCVHRLSAELTYWRELIRTRASRFDLRDGVILGAHSRPGEPPQ